MSFLETYYKWMESKTAAASSNAVGSYITAVASNNTILGTNTHFTTDLSVGENIAIWRSPELYDVFTVSSIANNTILTVTDAPLFTNIKSTYSYVEMKRNPLYDSRRILEYVDVDQTIPEFIVHFKEKYLNGIQFDTNADIRLLLKHSLDLYRAKGTPQALELLFRIIFGTDIDVYYPADDIFRLSDGVWYVPKYLEIVLSDHATLFNNREIYGSASGATAFVDRVIRRNVNGRLSDVLYISAVKGEFQHGDLLDYTGPVKLAPDLRIQVLGSLTTIDVDVNGSGSNFKIGDILDVSSTTGFGGGARVTNITNKSGLVQFKLQDGGYGYRTDGNTKVLISDSIIRLSNVRIDPITNPYVNTYFTIFDAIIQPTANISYVSANGVFTYGSNIYSYYPNNDIRGQGTVLSSNIVNATAGYIEISVGSGDLSSNQFFTYGNTVSAYVSSSNGYTNTTATANVIGTVNNLSVTIGNPAFIPNVNDQIVQRDNTGFIRASGVIDKIDPFGANTAFVISTSNGIFQMGDNVYNMANVVIGSVIDISVSIGVIGSNGYMRSDVGNYIYGKTSNTRAMITSISSGTGASISISNNFLYTETVLLSNNYMSNYANVYLGANAYGFPANPTANAGTIIATTDSYISINVGRISAITNLAEGASYTSPPIVRIYDPFTYNYNRKDYVLTTISGIFTRGEVVTQLATDARGLVLSSNGTVSHIKRLRFLPEQDFIPTINSTTLVVGTLSGVSVNVTSVDFDDDAQSGFDAIVTTNLSVANGALASVAVVDSGFGFTTDQQVTLTNNSSSAFGYVNCITSGTGSGFYKEKGGFLSDQKKVHDGYYYQDFSYDIRSPVTLDKYVDMLKQIAHVAGTMNFASLVTASDMDAEVTFGKSKYIIGVSSPVPGAVFYESSGYSYSNSASIGKSQAFFTGVGQSNSVSTAIGYAITGVNGVGQAAGNSTASASVIMFKSSQGTSTGNSSVNGVIAQTIAIAGNASGTSFAIAPSVSVNRSAGTSAGQSTATGVKG